MENANELTGYGGIFMERLSDLMRKEKVTQATLAKYLGLSRQAISTYTDGSVLPSVENLRKICEFFKVSSDYFLGLSTSANPDMDLREIANTTGLHDLAISNLMKFNGTNDSFDKHHDKTAMFTINAILCDFKELRTLSESFQKRYELECKCSETSKRIEELQNEANKKGKSMSELPEIYIKNEHGEQIDLFSELHRLKKEKRWFKFLSAECMQRFYECYVDFEKEFERERSFKHAKKHK